MSKITLDVNGSDVTTVLTILNNLKAGLINEIKVDGVSKPISSSSTSKYISPREFKERLKKR